MWKQRKFFILLLVCGFIATGFLVLFFSNIHISVTPARTSLVPTPIPLIKPGARKISISGIVMNDFFQTSKVVGSSSDIAIIENQENYTIVYLQKFNQFLITILLFPFTTNRAVAEQKFIEILNITKEDACRLSVSVTTTQSVNRELAGKEFPLSFCVR